MEQRAIKQSIEGLAKREILKVNVKTECDRQNHLFVLDEAEGTVGQRKLEVGVEGLAKKEIIEGVK